MVAVESATRKMTTRSPALDHPSVGTVILPNTAVTLARYPLPPGKAVGGGGRRGGSQRELQ